MTGLPLPFPHVPVADSRALAAWVLAKIAAESSWSAEPQGPLAGWLARWPRVGASRDHSGAVGLWQQIPPEFGFSAIRQPAYGGPGGQLRWMRDYIARAYGPGGSWAASGTNGTTPGGGGGGQGSGASGGTAGGGGRGGGGQSAPAGWYAGGTG